LNRQEARDLVATQDRNPDLDVKTIIKDAEESGVRKTPKKLAAETRKLLGIPRSGAQNKK
ncbi:MAG: MFS transporter, partial [Bifidobacteriales bacterium]|nr:MFS transporter [Bifidobacteriales bacterium]